MGVSCLLTAESWPQCQPLISHYVNNYPLEAIDESNYRMLLWCLCVLPVVISLPLEPLSERHHGFHIGKPQFKCKIYRLDLNI